MTTEQIKEMLHKSLPQLKDAEVRKSDGTNSNLLRAIGNDWQNSVKHGLSLRIKPCQQGVGFILFSGVKLINSDTQNLYGPWLYKKVADIFNSCRSFVSVNLSKNKITPNGKDAAESGTVVVTFSATEDDNAKDLESALGSLVQFFNDPDNIKKEHAQYNQNNQGTINDYCRQRFGINAFDKPDSDKPTSRQQEDNPMITQIKSLLEANLNVILTGAPGTGKTWMAKKVAYAITRDTEGASQEESHIAFVQFHPGYDYSDFVIGMKPRIEGGQVVFDWKDGIFKEFADKAKVDPEHNYAFLVDEINRADLSRVFGELFSLLEEEYRYCKEDGGTERNAKGVTLPNGTNFVIPKNLYIIGTMNDIDRSVESMDFALRRRFAWYEVYAESSKHIIGDKVSDKNAVQKLESAMTSLNDCISGKKSLKVDDETIDFGGILGSAFELGGAIFAKYEKYNGKDDAYKRLWDNHIKNILSEYLRGRPGRDEKLLPALRKIFDAAVNDASKKEEDPKSEKNVSEGNAPDAVNLQQN